MNIPQAGVYMGNIHQTQTEASAGVYMGNIHRTRTEAAGRGSCDGVYFLYTPREGYIRLKPISNLNLTKSLCNCPSSAVAFLRKWNNQLPNVRALPFPVSRRGAV